MRKKERRICRNQLSVILIGWGRYRKGRHCRNINCYGVLLLGLVHIFLIHIAHLLYYAIRITRFSRSSSLFDLQFHYKVIFLEVL